MTNAKIKTQSSAFEKVMMIGSEQDNSNIKINLSDEASEIFSINKVSMLSGLRKGSDTLQFEQAKLKAISQMA